MSYVDPEKLNRLLNHRSHIYTTVLIFQHVQYTSMRECCARASKLKIKVSPLFNPTVAFQPAIQNTPFSKHHMIKSSPGISSRPCSATLSVLSVRVYRMFYWSDALRPSRNKCFTDTAVVTVMQPYMRSEEKW